MIFAGGILIRVEQPPWRRLEALVVFGKHDREPLAIGGGLLMGERQVAKRFRQSFRSGALCLAAGNHRLLQRGCQVPAAQCSGAVLRPLQPFKLGSLAFGLAG